MNLLELERRHALWRRRLLVIAAIIGAVSLGCLGWVTWSVADARLLEARQTALLDESLQDGNAGPPGSEGSAHRAETRAHVADWPELSEGDLVGRIRIERLGIEAIVLHGTGARTLRRSVGHVPGTALPGEPGNVGLAGHRDSFFRELADAAVGDLIRVESVQGTVTYQVDRVFVVGPRDVHVLDPPSDGEMVTLVTCYPFHYVGPAPDRFIVQATRVDGP